MANLTADYGFAPVRSVGGGPVATERCEVAAGYGTALYVGDPVKRAGSGANGFPTIQVADAGDTNIYGVIVGVEPSGPDTLTTLYSAASTADTVIVALALPTTLFRVNASGATGARLDDIGLHFDHVAGSGDTLTGRSGYALDMGEDASAGATSGRQWRLIQFDRSSQNEYSTTVTTDTVNVDLIVSCAESEWITGNGA